MTGTKKRLFIAIDISPETRLRLQDAQLRLRAALPDTKWVKPAGMHVTLVFLGYVDEAAEAAVKRATGRVARRLVPYDFAVEGIGGWPSARRPRVVWAGIKDEGGFEIAAAELTAELATIGYESEERSFRPHVTLGRIKNPRRPEDPDAFTAAAAEVGSTYLHARELVLYCSTLSRAGAEYKAEAVFALGNDTGIDTNTCL